MVHLLFDIAGAVATCCPTFSIENIPAEYKVVVYIYVMCRTNAENTTTTYQWLMFQAVSLETASQAA
jgi:hypothetical protein